MDKLCIRAQGVLLPHRSLPGHLAIRAVIHSLLPLARPEASHLHRRRCETTRQVARRAAKSRSQSVRSKGEGRFLKLLADALS